MPGTDGAHGLPGDPSDEKGVHGDPGPQGLPGVKGMPGSPGNRGIQGFDGISGERVSKATLAAYLIRKCKTQGSGAALFPTMTQSIIFLLNVGLFLFYAKHVVCSGV